MRIAVYNRVFEAEDIPIFNRFFEFAQQQQQIDLIIYDQLYNHISATVPFDVAPEVFTNGEDLTDDVDFMISLGGDGTILDAVVFVGRKEIPILGINLGRLGFLADISTDNIEYALQCLMNRNYTVESRSVIRLDSNEQLFENFPYALNDFTIHKKDTSAMIKVKAYLNGQFLNNYWCDGLIISTPTGSTGYSLSCGGPVIFPQTDALVITPISPHHLNVRPIVVPKDYVLSFEVEGRAENFLCTMDSRQESIDRNTMLAVRIADFKVKLVRVGAHNFLDTIRNKMHWGVDARN